VIGLLKGLSGVLPRPLHYLIHSSRVLLEIVSHIVDLTAQHDPAALLRTVQCHFSHRYFILSHHAPLLFCVLRRHALLLCDALQIALWRVGTFDPADQSGITETDSVVRMRQVFEWLCGIPPAEPKTG
jgi:hypothetical protein